MNNQEIKQVEKSFAVVIGKVLDFVDDKVTNATDYDKKMLKQGIYSVQQHLIKDIKAMEKRYDRTETNFNR